MTSLMMVEDFSWITMLSNSLQEDFFLFGINGDFAIMYAMKGRGVHGFKSEFR